MSNEKMREEFEAWETDADTGPLTDPMWLMRDVDEPDQYGIIEVQRNWEAWQASRAAVVVELPLDRTSEMSPWAGLLVHYHRDVRKRLIEAIELLGLKVKP